MTYKELIAKCTRSKEYQEQVYIGEISREFADIEIYNWDEQTRLTSYYIADWYCTDSKVGHKLYYFDGKAVGYSFQSGRKSDEYFKWFSPEDFEEIRKYVETFREEQPRVGEIIDINEDFSDVGYRVYYVSQLFQHHKDKGIYEGESVELVSNENGRGFLSDDDSYVQSTVKIRKKDGQELFVELKEMIFSFNF